METKNIPKEVTMKIIHLLSKVVSEDYQSWLPLSGLAFNPVSKHTYTSVNQLLLSFEMQQKNYEINNWLTFNQIRDASGTVRKGEKATPVVFTEVIYMLNDQKILPKDAKTLFLEAKKKNSSISTYKEIGIATKWFLRYYHVFNVAQTNDLIEVLLTKGQQQMTEIERDARAEQLLIDHNVKYVHSAGDTACYNPLVDIIRMPFTKQFTTSQNYYSVLFHELIHWTGNEKRLNRTFGEWDSPEYAFEELIAELGSSFLCAYFQLPAPLTSTTAYVKSWLTALQNDQMYLFKAMNYAERAMNYLIEKQTTSI